MVQLNANPFLVILERVLHYQNDNIVKNGADLMRNDYNRDMHYVGEFEVEGDIISGEIIYNKGNGVIVLNLNREVDTIVSAIGKKNYIIGKLNYGQTVTLFHTRCIRNHTQNFRLQNLQFIPEYMILGKESVENKQFNKLVCIIENGMHWSGLTSIDTHDYRSIKLTPHEDNPSYQWYGATIRFSSYLKNGLLKIPKDEVSEIVERLQIEIETEDKHEIEYFLKIRDKILAMISFAIKDNINIEEQYFNCYDDFYKNHEMIRYYKYGIITKEPYRDLFNTHHFQYNFFREQIPSEDISEKLEKLVPVFNLYMSLIKYNDMPTEMIFLNIVQAIETFHSRFFYNDKKKNYVKSVQERFGSKNNFDSIKKLLLNDTQMDENCNYIILVSRLNDLFIGKYDGLFYEFYGDDPLYAQTIADTRHYYTHYGKSKESKALKGDDLVDAIYILRWLLEYNVCLVLGIDIRQRIQSYLQTYFDQKKLDEKK